MSNNNIDKTDPQLAEEILVFSCQLCLDPKKPVATARTFQKLTQLLRHVSRLHVTTKEEYAVKYPNHGDKRHAYR